VTSWEDAARALGLGIDARTSGGFPIVSGEIEGLDVEASVTIDPMHAARRDRAMRLRVSSTVWLERELDLGVLLVSRPPSWLRASEARVGHPKLDDGFQLRALELGLARELFSIDELAAELEQFRHGAPAALIGDTFVKLERLADRDPHEHMPWLVRAAVRVAHAVTEARDRIGPSEGERVLDRAWSIVANDLGLAIDLDRTSMHGRVGSIDVEADAFIDGKVRKTRLHARFERALGLELRIVRQDLAHLLEKLMMRKEFEVGDRVFDRLFFIQGAPADAVRARLTEDARARLTALLDDTSYFEVNDEGIELVLPWLVQEPAALGEAIHAIASAAEAMQGTGEKRGPFR
jgi:hypothetical protein